MCMVEHKIIPYYFIYKQQTDWPSRKRHEGVAGLASLARDQKAEHSSGLVNSAALGIDR